MILEHPIEGLEAGVNEQEISRPEADEVRAPWDEMRPDIDDNAAEPDQVQHRYLEDALTAVAAGRTPAVAESRAVGCTIKFRD